MPLCVFLVLGTVRSAVGSAQLLMAQKFQQFRGLCNENLVSGPIRFLHSYPYLNSCFYLHKFILTTFANILIFALHLNFLGHTEQRSAFRHIWRESMPCAPELNPSQSIQSDSLHGRL